MRVGLDDAVAAAGLVRARGRASRSAKRSTPWPSLGRRAPQQRAQPREQLLERERLGQVVVGAGVEAGDAVGRPGRARSASAPACDRRWRAAAGTPRGRSSAACITSRMTASGRALATRSRAARPSPAEATAVALLHQGAVERVDHRRLVIDYQDFHSQSICGHPKTRRKFPASASNPRYASAVPCSRARRWAAGAILVALRSAGAAAAWR